MGLQEHFEENNSLLQKKQIWHPACVLQGEMDNVKDMLIFPIAINP